MGRLIKSNISILLTATLALSGCGNVASSPVSEDLKEPDQLSENERKVEKSVFIDVPKADENPEAVAVFKELERINGDSLKLVTNADGYVTFMKGTITDKPIDNPEFFDEILNKLLPILTSNTDSKISVDYRLTDDYGNDYLTCTEKLDGDEISVNVVKIILDENEYMKGLTSSIVPYVPPTGDEIPGKDAVKVVKDTIQKKYPNKDFKIITVDPTKEYKYIVDAVSLQEYCSKVFIVVSDNPDFIDDGIETPYIEHYVSLNGEYLGEAPTYISVESDTQRDFDQLSEWFANDLPQKYSVSYKDDNGNIHNITVPVVFDGDRYYLEDTKRKIICADYYSFAYDMNIDIISSENNKDWDLDEIIAYHNYINVYDFYKKLGWDGPDGVDGPMMILMDYQDINHTPIDGMCYMGIIEGVNVFTGTTRAKDYHKALDVVGHEFTHAVSNSMMADVRYMNETGAINESLSDIMGECIELKHGENNGEEITPYDAFCIGEETGGVIRDLINPNLYGQPKFVGGEYYVPSAAIPNKLNDLGGVHLNSSLLSSILPKMYYDTGLGLSDIMSVWGTVMCVMVPRSGYRELKEILPLSCELSHYASAVDSVEETLVEANLNSDNPYENIENEKCQILFDVPPWLDWNRVRMEIIDEEANMRVTWPKKGTNQIILTVSPGRYRINLIQYDEECNMNGLWQYFETGWKMGENDENNYVEISQGDRYRLKDIPYGQ